MNHIAWSMMSLAFGGNKETLLNERDKSPDFWKELHYYVEENSYLGTLGPSRSQGGLDKKVSNIARNLRNIKK